MNIGTMEVGSLLTSVAGMGFRAMVLLALAGLATLALHRRSAAARHLVWTAAVVGVLALPVLTATLPRLAVAVPAAWATAWQPVQSGDASPARSGEAAPATSDDAGRAIALSPGGGLDRAGEAVTTWMGAGAADGRSLRVDPGANRGGASEAVARPLFDAPPGTATPPRPDAATLLFLLWLAGAALLLAPVALGWIGVRRLERGSRPWGPGPVAHRATRLGLRIGLRREFRLLRGPAGTMPMTWGIVRPAVVLPSDAAGWPEERLEAVLLHELAHVKRRDCLTQLLAEVVRALHWPDPLAWVAARRLRVEREHACDDVALDGGARPSSYADELLRLARSYHASRSTTMAAVAMARPGQLTGRLLAVLDERRRRGGIGRAAALRTAAIALVVAATLGAAAPATQVAQAAEVTADVQVAQAGPVTAATPVTAAAPASGAAPVTESAPAQDPAPAGLALAASSQDMTCVTDGDDWDQVQHQSNDDVTTIRMRRRGCELDVRLEGEVEFDAAGVGIARLGRDGLVRIEEDNGDIERVLEIRPGAGSAPAYEYRVDRRGASFDGQAQAWYRAVLVELFRRAGFAAEERVRAILARGGVDAVLAEMDQLSSGYVQAKYFQELVRQAELTEAQYRMVIRTAARRVDSDHYLSEILRGVAEHQELTARLLDDFVAAALALESDHYRTETLRGVIDSGRLTGPQVAAVLDATREMESDHYRSELLTHVADRYALEPAFRPAYLRAAAGLESDHYRTEVLKRLLRRDDLSSQELAEVVASATMIDSDHYRTEILRQVAELGMADPTIQQAYFRSLEGIESDHYALEALRGLIRQERIPGDLLRTILAWSPAIESDHYLSELLREVARRFPLEGATRDAFLRAMDEVESDHYRGQIADALLRAERGGGPL